jgi:hypothetical protein
MLTALGLPVAVRCHGSRVPELREAIARAWQDCLISTTAPHQDVIPVDAFLDDDPELVRQMAANGHVASTHVDALMDWLTPTITVKAITRNAGRFVMLHACGLANPTTGASIALIASSGTGKTTIAQTFGTSWAYLSDETVAVRPDGMVLAYPKPLSVLDTPQAAIKRQLAASSLGLIQAPDRCRLVGMLLLTRTLDNSPLRSKRVATVHALAAVAPHMSFFSSLERPLQQTASLLKGVGGLLSVQYSEAEQLRGLVDSLLTSARSEGLSVDG